MNIETPDMSQACLTISMSGLELKCEMFCRTVPLNNWSSCITVATSRTRPDLLHDPIGRPNQVISPVSVESRPVTALNKVLFPLPERPVITTNSPDATLKLTSLKRRFDVSLNRRLMFVPMRIPFCSPDGRAGVRSAVA
ncbi:hypothetical protein D3C80_1735580 [compost metagenome]